MLDAALEPTVTPRRAGTLATSTLLHGLLAGSLVVGPLWTVREPPEPPERMSTFPTIRIEPIVKALDAPRGSPNGGSPNAPSRAPRRAALVQPSRLPDALPAPAAAESASADDEAIPRGAPGETSSLGVGPGTEPGPVGVPDGGAAADILPANAPEVTPPVELVRTQPPYPEAAIRAHMQGVVILEAIIDTDGNVRSGRVLRSANPLLDAAAEKAILTWRYRPARVGARPVAVYLTVTVRFGIA